MFIQIILILLILYSSLKRTIEPIVDWLYKSYFCNCNTTRKKKNVSFQNPFHNNYEFIGNLYNKEKNIMLKLYGRERIRYVWDYFIIYNNHSTETKIDLSSHKNRLEHLDSLYIEIFQTDFILYKNENKYKYYPYIFYN